MVNINNKDEEHQEPIKIKMGYFWCRPHPHLNRSRVGGLGGAHVDCPSTDLPFVSCKTEQYLHVVTFYDSSCSCHLCELSCESRSNVPP